MTDWVTADWHFNHKRILLFERHQFETIEQHNEFIIQEYNKKVGKDDTCYVLGDVGWGKVGELKSLISKMRGNKILIIGNHDRLLPSDYKEIGFSRVIRGPMFYDENEGIGAPAGRIILSHEPVREALDNPYVINVHGHLHNSDLDLPNFFNVNVARTGYAPVCLHRFVNDSLSLTKNRHEKIGTEWYFSHYKWDKGCGPCKTEEGS
jgi:calcineurin-like phosphoesterase family protein